MTLADLIAVLEAEDPDMRVNYGFKYCGHRGHHPGRAALDILRAEGRMTVDPEEEAENLLNEIERKYPPEKCSLVEYREVLDHLGHSIRERVRQLDDEIG